MNQAGRTGLNGHVCATRRFRRFGLSVGLLAGALSISACAANMPRPIQTDVPLGRVVVYRNGVASFERRAIVNGNRLTLQVPGERLDDFLKSLSVTDARTGKLVPVSYKTLAGGSDVATICIELPTAGSHDLRISYVTESPAWKPTYRLKLDRKGHARLESWAIVDNVSGEDWKRVTVGVGSTSALSFKYDLQSVRFVERETLHDELALGAAPPTGGSPYAVAGEDVQVMGRLKLDSIADVRKPKDVAREAAAAPTGAAQAAAEVPTDAPAKSTEATRRDAEVVQAIAKRLKSSRQKIQIVGYARAGEADTKTSSTERATAVRDELVAQGVAADQIEVVGSGAVSRDDGVRIVAQSGAPITSAQATVPGERSDDPAGAAYFLAATPLSIERDHSAMVSLLSTDADAREVYYYDPISSRGSKRFAFRAALLKNPSDNTLDAGPFTVYAGDQFLGEGLSEPIAGRSRAFVPFALDRKLIVEPVVSAREQIDNLVTIERGVLRAEARSIRRTELELYNRGSDPATVYLRHPITEGYKLEAPTKNVDKMRGAYLIEVEVPANGQRTLTIEESTPIDKSVDIRSDGGIAELGLYLKTGTNLDSELRQKLEQIIAMHRSMQEIQERIETVNAQMQAYRERIDELNVQLVSLRRVAQAQELSRNLAKKMDEISNKLQKATISVADLQGGLLTQRVALEDRLAELTLERRKDTVAGR